MNRVKKFTQAYLQAPWRKQLQALGLILLILLFVVLSASIYLNLNARIAAYGREILMMQENIEQMELHNSDLVTQMGILNSPTKLEARAIEMGFKSLDSDELLYIVTPGYSNETYVAQTLRLEPVERITLTLPPNFSESLIDWMRKRIVTLSHPLLEVRK